MDIDLFIARNTPVWNRLAQLTSQARHGLGRLAPAEIDELVVLYQQVSAHLSHARAAYRDPALTMRLTTLVTQASGVIYRGVRVRATPSPSSSPGASPRPCTRAAGSSR